jgi:hypothetical protein
MYPQGGFPSPFAQDERIKKEYPRRGSGAAGPRFFDQKPGFTRRRPRRCQKPRRTS